ncbi:phosducin-like protein 2 [Pleurodeles waltl]|uniref:phosducin-like protein 2 n=1 Tax=Pleurodeles waltl TaxID=8319 RepID=UPI003709C336
MALKAANATCVLGRYVHALIDSAEAMVPDLTQDIQRPFGELLSDAQAAAKQIDQSGLDSTDSVARALGASIATRRDAWLRSSGFSSDGQTTLLNLPFDEEKLFGDKADSALERFKDSWATDPNEDTEWNDVLRDFGIIPPKKEEKDEIEEMVLKLQKEAEGKPYERMTLQDLKEAEDEFDEDDERAIEQYRQQRLLEWKYLQKTKVFGELTEIPGDQYINEVTNAREGTWVVIHLYRSGIPMCTVVDTHLGVLARKFPETKFLKANVNSCIPNYHDTYLPTVIVYKNGQIMGQYIGLNECGGMHLKVEELEWKLTEVGAICSDMEKDNRKEIDEKMEPSIRSTSFHNSDEDLCDDSRDELKVQN